MISPDFDFIFVLRGNGKVFDIRLITEVLAPRGSPFLRLGTDFREWDLMGGRFQGEG